MKRLLSLVFVLVFTASLFTLTGCKKNKENKNSSAKQEYSDINSSDDSNSESSSINDDSLCTTCTDSIVVDNSSITDNSSGNSQATAKPQQTTTQRKPITTTVPQQIVTQPPQTTIQPQRQLIVPTQAQCSVIENEIMRLVNEYRASLGIAPYGIENKIIQGARIRAEETSHINCFGHNRPDGTSFSTVFAQIGYSSGGASAENLAGFSNSFLGQDCFECSDAELKAVAREMFNSWKASPDHNSNMINTTRTKMGVGVYALYETNLRGIKEVGFYGIQLFTAR